MWTNDVAFMQAFVMTAGAPRQRTGTAENLSNPKLRQSTPFQEKRPKAPPRVRRICAMHKFGEVFLRDAQ
jgi:hypothetical protein